MTEVLHTIMPPKDTESVANGEDPDQTALRGAFDLGLHCLLRPICLKIRYGLCF